MQLSYSALGTFKNCPRCFWLDRNKKFLRPQGIKSGMPVSVDNILKKKLDTYRGSLPPILAACPELKGFQLYTGAELSKMRNWKTNPLKMTAAKGNVIVGAFDDLLYNPTTEEFGYLDYKSTGKEPDQVFGERYYQNQCDIYTNFLVLGNRKVAPFGVLYFFWPMESEKGLIDFGEKAIFLKPNIANADQIFKEAIACLEGPMPEASLDCEYCKYGLLYPREGK
jgi:hypothetical protein